METSERKLYIMPHKRIKLPTGVYFNIPKNNMLLVLEKTSVPNKTGLISGARVIDENYQGEFIASIINTSDQQAYLQPGQKFIQVVLVPLY
jgi:dUTPase